MKNLLCIVTLALCTCSHAAEWQWAVDTGVKTHGKAFLWVPPECEQVRGLIVGQQVILEQAVFEDPQIRAACARENLAILLLVPGAIGYDDFGPDGKGEATYNRIVTQLAEISGYAELATAPFLTIGHSGGALPAWRMGYWKPERCFGVIGLRAAPIGPPAHDPKAELNGVPVLVVTGQYETWDEQLGSEHHWRWCRGDMLAWRAKWKNFLGSVLVQPGAGHFNWDDKVAAYVAMFVEKAARRRLPEKGRTGALARPGAPRRSARAKAGQAGQAGQAGAPVLRGTPSGELLLLRELAREDGWLTDHTLTTPSNFETAAYGDYKGDPNMTFWHLDEELARANEAFGQTHGKKLQLVTVLKDGEPEPNAWMQSIDLVAMEDGITMKVAAAFVTELPPVFALSKAAKPQPSSPGTLPGQSIPSVRARCPHDIEACDANATRSMQERSRKPHALCHAKGPIQYRLIGSWGGGGEQVGPDTFRIRFDRLSFANKRPGLMFMAYHPGDDDYACTEQPCTINFPKENKQGKPQAITFAEIPDQTQGAKQVELRASSDAGLPVRFAAIEGPVKLDGSKLMFTEIPPRAKFPVKVTVAAYQWGRSVEPKIRTAEVLERSFLIERGRADE
ncbi:MAG: hypothetical protein ISS31_10615 [Kiritimatiellae bacterium]|nr:hypothetical protein [Kiritimatiellia bacterium]